MKYIAMFLDGPIANDGRVQRIINSLSGMELEIHLFYIDGNNNDSKLFGDKVELFFRKKSSSFIINNFFFHRSFEELKVAFIEIDYSYDYIYCNDYPLLNLCVELKRIHNCKLIYDSHEIYIETINQFFPTNNWRKLYGIPSIFLNKWFHSIKEKQLLKHVDLMITVSDSFRLYFIRNYGVNNILVIKNCPDLNQFPKKKKLFNELFGFPEDDYVFLYQGNLNKGRSLDRLIHLFNNLSNKYRLVIIGGGTLLPQLKKLCLDKKVSNVHFLGKVDFNSLLEYTACADFGINIIENFNLSKRLTLPNKVFEYMAAGIPVISNDCPEAKKIIESYNCGFIVNDSSLKKILNDFKKLPLHRSELERIGRKGQLAIERKYNWENEIEKLKKYLLKNHAG